MLPLLANLLGSLEEETLDEFSLRDEKALFQDVCFVAAAAYSQQVIILRNVQHLQQFHSQLAARCQRKVTEPDFDFTNGRILFGLWSAGEGCGAHHILTSYEREPSGQHIQVEAHFVPYGPCPYELLRPLWLSAPGGAATDVELRVVSP